MTSHDPPGCVTDGFGVVRLQFVGILAEGNGRWSIDEVSSRRTLGSGNRATIFEGRVGRTTRVSLRWLARVCRADGYFEFAFTGLGTVIERRPSDATRSVSGDFKRPMHTFPRIDRFGVF